MVFNLIPVFSEALMKQQVTMELMSCNEATAQYQLSLTKEEAELLVDTRNEALKVTDRLELGGGIIKKLILCFKDSPYISQYNYAETISELIDTFYYYKNETQDEMSDDELIDLMKELFDKKCNGCMALLQGRDLEAIARAIRYGESVAEEEAEEGEDEIDE